MHCQLPTLTRSSDSGQSARVSSIRVVGISRARCSAHRCSCNNSNRGLYAGVTCSHCRYASAAPRSPGWTRAHGRRRSGRRSRLCGRALQAGRFGRPAPGDASMWTLKNRTPYAAERNWTRDKRGVHQWIVAVKATFTIAKDGKLSLSDEQVPPVLAPEYHGEPGMSSLRYDSDLLRAKPCTDVIVDACAHAPRGKKAARVPVS